MEINTVCILIKKQKFKCNKWNIYIITKTYLWTLFRGITYKG